MRPSTLDGKRAPMVEQKYAHRSDPTRSTFQPSSVSSSPNSNRRSSASGRLFSKFHLPEPAEGWLSLILLAIAISCVVSSIIAANWVRDPINSYLIYPPLLGLFVGVGIAKIPYFPQSVLHVVACLIGISFSLLITSILAYHVPLAMVLGNLNRAFAGHMADVDPLVSEMTFFFYLGFLCFFLGYFGSWLIYRARLPWLVVLVYCSILLVNLNYVDLARHDFTYLVVIMIGALALLLARVSIVVRIAQWKSEGLYTDRAWIRGITTRCMQVASVVTLLVLFSGYFLPVQPQPQSGKVFWDYLDTMWTNISSGHVPWYNLGRSVGLEQSATNFFGDTLRITENAVLPTGEALTYTSSDQQPHYLEAISLNHFDGHSWSTSTGNNSSDFAADDPLPLDVMGNNTSRISTTVHMVQPPDGTKPFLFAPAQPVSFDVGTRIFRDGSNAGSVDAWTGTGGHLLSGFSYHVISLMPSSDRQTLSLVSLPHTDSEIWNSDFLYRHSIKQFYLNLPGDLSPSVLKTTLNWTRGTDNAYDAMKALESHLSDSTQFQYSVTNPPLPANKDIVDVLLQRKVGYCTFYASALAVMGRQLGIPTRIVNGYSVGQYQSGRKVWSVLGSDAHSWVQAYFPATGWVNFDPTPGFSVDRSSASKIGATVAPTPTAQATKTPVPTLKAAPTQKAHALVKKMPGSNNTTPDRQGNDFSPWLLVAVGLLFVSLLFLAGALSLRWWRRQYEGSSIVAGVYWRLCRIANWAGLGPKRWQTPHEYSRMLGEQFPLQASSFHLVTDLFVRERWGAPAQAPQKQEEKRVELLWPDLRASLLRSILRRPKREA